MNIKDIADVKEGLILHKSNDAIKVKLSNGDLTEYAYDKWSDNFEAPKVGAKIHVIRDANLLSVSTCSKLLENKECEANKLESDQFVKTSDTGLECTYVKGKTALTPAILHFVLAIIFLYFGILYFPLYLVALFFFFLSFSYLTKKETRIIQCDIPNNNILLKSDNKVIKTIETPPNKET